MSEIVQVARKYAQSIQVLYDARGIHGRHRVNRIARGGRHMSVSVRIASSIRRSDALNLAPDIALEAGCQNVMGVVTPDLPDHVTYQFQLPGYIDQETGLSHGMWMTYTGKDVTGLGVGLADNRREVQFKFSPPHAGVFGSTGSGKSETVRRILTSLTKTYSPDELGLILCDPDHDFDDSFTGLDHLLAPIAHMPDEIERNLTFGVNILLQRREQNLRGKNKPKQRVLVVLDETAAILEHSREIAEGALMMIGAEGLKYGIHLLISTQKPVGDEFKRFMHHILNRWVGLVDKALTSVHLTGRGGMHCHQLTGYGDLMHVAALVEERVLIALVDEKELDILPRGNPARIETPPAVLTPDRVINAAADVDDRGPGRPSVEIEPELVAEYFRGPNVTENEARERLDLKRRAHEVHRAWAVKLMKAFAAVGVMPVAIQPLARYLVADARGQEVSGLVGTALEPMYKSYARQLGLEIQRVLKEGI